MKTAGEGGGKDTGQHRLPIGLDGGLALPRLSGPSILTFRPKTTGIQSTILSTWEGQVLALSRRGFSTAVLCSRSQGAQYPLLQGYGLNHNRDPECSLRYFA